MAAKRGKKQARRKEESSIPGYAWLLVGLLIGGVAAVTLYVKMPHAIDNLLPHPNPAAQPTAAKDPGVAPEGNPAASQAASPALPKKPRYTFYALLPEKEVIIPDEELSAQVKAEAAANLASKQQAAPPVGPGVPANPPTSPTTSVTGLTQTTTGSTRSVPSAPAAVATAKTLTPPIAGANPALATAASPTPVSPSTTATDTTPATPKSGQYLLQAGAFRNDKQADDLKARIAMLGLVGRVEVVQTPNGEMHRVRLGPYATASELEQAKQKLSSGGVTGSVAVRLK